MTLIYSIRTPQTKNKLTRELDVTKKYKRENSRLHRKLKLRQKQRRYVLTRQKLWQNRKGLRLNKQAKTNCKKKQIYSLEQILLSLLRNERFE